MPWVFDGPNKRIYEAPPGTDYELVGGLRRYYSTGAAPAITDWDLLADIWTPYVDWFHAGGHRYELAFARSGGNLRPSGVNSPTDIQVINGWRLILADYPHDATINGNLFQESAAQPLWDLSLHTTSAIGRTVNSSANLLAYVSGSAGGGASPEEVAASVWTYISRTLTEGSGGGTCPPTAQFLTGSVIQNATLSAQLRSQQFNAILKVLPQLSGVLSELPKLSASLGVQQLSGELKCPTQ